MSKPPAPFFDGPMGKGGPKMTIPVGGPPRDPELWGPEHRLTIGAYPGAAETVLVVRARLRNGARVVVDLLSSVGREGWRERLAPADARTIARLLRHEEVPQAELPGGASCRRFGGLTPATVAAEVALALDTAAAEVEAAIAARG